MKLESRRFPIAAVAGRAGDVAWRRRHGQRLDAAFWSPSSPVSTLDAARVERVVSRLDQLAAQWNQLPVGGELALTWPSLSARALLPRAT